MAYYDLSKLAYNPSSKEAQGDLTAYYKGRKNPVDYYNEATKNLGVPDARATVTRDRQAINDTNSLLDAVDPSVTGRTQGGLVTEAQRQGLVNKERAPITEALGDQTRAYTSSSANFADLMGQANQQAQFGQAADSNYLQALMQRLDNSRYNEEAARQAAAEAQNNAWIEALQNQISELGNQINTANSGIDELGAIGDSAWDSLNSRLEVKPNYGQQQDNHYNPQQTYNPQQQSKRKIQNTSNPQKAYSGNINKLKQKNLKVKTKPKSKQRVVVNNKKKNYNVTVNGGRSNYNPSLISNLRF